MLTEEQIEKNKITFLKLIAQIDIEGADTQGLVDYLDNNDFFTAPASTQYHCCYKGGLCEHSLHVYRSLVNLADMYQDYIPKYDKNTLLVVGLLHDISKVNFYEGYVMNKKIYNEKGSKHDNMGNFDWFAQDAYKVKDAKEREIYGNHEESSAILISRYIPLNTEEMISVMHHHCNMNDGSQWWDLTECLNKNPLLTLLHAADFMSCFLLERNSNE